MYSINISERTLRFKQPAGTSRGVFLERKSYFLKLTSEEFPGVEGIGECAPLPGLSCDDIPEYGRILTEVCKMVEYTGAVPYETLRPYPSILFGLETAFAQLKAGGSTCLYDTPFGRGEEGIPINGLVWMGTHEEMVERLGRKLEEGYRCVKLKIGAIDFESELELVRRVRDRFPPDVVELRLDANGGFANDVALSRLCSLAPYGIHSVEQPIKQHQWKDMAMLCRESPVPIALDEELIGVNMPDMKRELLETIRPAYIILKPSLHGGMKGTAEWVALAEGMGTGSWITSALESNVGLNAVAHLAAKTYGPAIAMPQGLGTGLLFENNIDMPIEIRDNRLWYNRA